jgi:hypothetical protein
VVEQLQVDATGGAWINDLICAGPAGNPFLAIKVLSGVEKSSLVRYADGAAEVLAEDIERLVPTANGPLGVGSDGTIYRVDAVAQTLTPLSEALGDVKGQVVAAVPSPDGSHLALSAMDFETSPSQGRVYVIDLEDGEIVEKEFACDIYPVWVDNENLFMQDSCTSDVGVIYTTELEVVGEGQPPEYGYYTNHVTDETGATFFPSEFAIRVVEPGTETSSELTRLFTYPGAILVVPESVRPNWEGPAFIATNVVDTPVTTFVEAPAPGVPGPEEVAPETPAWLMAVAVIAAAGVFWLLIRRPTG